MSGVVHLREGFGLACRACGGPWESFDAPCPYCGAPPDATPDARRRLAAHRARLARDLQQLRAVVGYELSAALIGQPGFRFFYGAAFLGGVLGSGVVLAVLGFTSILLQSVLGVWTFAAFAFTIAATMACLFGTLYYLLRHAAIRGGEAMDQARRYVVELEATVPVRCASCGGHAAAVALGPDASLPCPWCDSPLVPPGEHDEAVRAATDLVMAHRQDLGEARFQEAMRKISNRKRPVPRIPLPGFKARAGVILGHPEGIQVWGAADRLEGHFLLRAEVEAPTGLARPIWIAKEEAEPILRRVAAGWDYELPTEPWSWSPANGWAGFGQLELDLRRHPALTALLSRMRKGDGLYLDPAGLSHWRICSLGEVLLKPWSLLQRHVPDYLAAVRELDRSSADR